MEFEWDERKSAANEAKHDVSFRLAVEIFRGPRIEIIDLRRDYGEVRVIAVGLSGTRLLRVVYTRRNGVIRIISAWKASKRDRKNFETAREDGSL